VARCGSLRWVKLLSVVRNSHGTQSNESDYLIIALVYDPLTVPGSPQTIAPRLASKWEASDDLRRHCFILADGARFHDGRPHDALGIGDPNYARDLPQQHRDLTRAKALLDSAGFDRATRYSLVTYEETPGQGKAASLFATRLFEVAVGLDVVCQDPGTFYDQT
jgi:ABC-type transport system substrate-binding protein